MSAVAVDAPYDGERWLRAWREMDVPDGWRAEVIVAGSITVTPPPSPPHNLIAGLLDKALWSVVPDDTGIYQTLGVRVDAIAKVYIPDLVVVSRDALRTEESEVSAEHVLLAVEITSRDNAHHDRKAKRWGYAHGHVPFYLLVDRWERPNASVTLFSDPENGDYTRDVRVPFGTPITLPAPFDARIESAEFPPGV